jgi:UDP-N-acetylmuramoyl-tripeptide--D-alanyl-D-alanine ligase
VSLADIRERLLDWEPAAMRGEWRHSGGRGLYLDCYNASPAAMADALAAFLGIAPSDEPRLYVLGCMEELGAEAARYHTELGRSLPLRSVDHAIVIGVHAQAVCEGAVAAGISHDQIETAPSAASIRSRVAEFRGSVFLKGSRRYALEQAVDSAALAEAVHA